ncbi:MAG: FAD-binding and (Fe-S)-binding domain-containing protein [Dehalococcoidia bacterium]
MTSLGVSRAVVEELEDVERELQRRVNGEVRFDRVSRVLYSTDASIYQIEPVGVVVPRNKEDVQAVVEVASRAGIAVLPRGGGTSLSGQTVNRAIVLDFSKYLHRILEVNLEERWARVEPGVVLQQLNLAAGKHGLHFPPDPTTANRACVGGSIGNNSCGSHSIRFGKTIDHVRELEVVLADATRTVFHPLESPTLEAKLALENLEGRVYREVRRIAEENREDIAARFPKIMRRVGGYNLDQFVGDGPMDLTRMVVGSEGTLCVVTEAKVNLEPQATMKGLAVLHHRSLIEAMEATVRILEHQPAAVELVDKFLLDRCRESMGFARRMSFVEGDPAALLLVEFWSESEAELKAKLDRLREDILGQNLASACLSVTDGEAQANVWAVRSAGLGLLMSTRGDVKPLPFVEDTAVSPEKLPDYIRRFDEVVREHGTTAAYYGHASVGCLHIRPLVNLKTEEGMQHMVSIATGISELVLEFGGAMSGEHGDGIVRGVWNEKMFGPQLYQAFQEVKRAFDPQGIMNPGKIVDCPPMTENLRYGPRYHALEPETYLDFPVDGGYAQAVEQCNGMGACRKMTEGTMCPSYMVTREEEHSTRGRANLLRAALSGALPPEELAGQRIYEALDLCLECKGCKGECPATVDMAKLKYEFLARYYQEHRVPLRARLFAYINALSRLGCRFAPVSNWATRLPLTRLLLHRLLGIHRDRRLPPFARPTFPAWFQRHRPSSDGRRGPVVLFNDTFMNYNYPSVGKAAVRLLERAGFRVILANSQCCARPMISKGFLEMAKVNARFNVDLLYPFAVQGIPIVGCEPSCLLTLRDEYPGLLRDEPSKTVAGQSYLIDEFLAALHERGELELEFQPVERRVLFHGHCHQKALVGTAPSLKVLRLPPGFQVEEVDSGCCGMAGAFGYEREHYTTSLAIGAQRLFPAVTSHPDWQVAVMGISCRQQVEHATGRRALHLVEVLSEALPP